MASRRATESSYGGYCYQFVSEVPSDLYCELCTEVLRQPHLTTCCGKHSCQSCLAKWDRKKASSIEGLDCPFCRNGAGDTDGYSHFLDKGVERKIKHLEVHCEYYKEGCDWVGELNQIECHTSHCRYALTKCTKCGDRMKHNDLEDHLANECIMRTYQCQHCGVKGTFRSIVHKHCHECPNYPLKCPNRCRSRVMKRASVKKHLDICPKQQISCLFELVGCGARFIRMDQESHMNTHGQEHILMLCNAFQQGAHALITEAELLAQSCSRVQQLPLECMKTIAGVYNYELEVGGPPLTFRMGNYSHFKTTDTYWSSPVFSTNGYRMFLAVVACGVESGRHSHLSVMLKASKHDKHSCWKRDGITIKLLHQDESSLISDCSCTVYGSQIPWKDLEGKDGLPVRLFTCATFAQQNDVENFLLQNDSLVFQIQRSIVIPGHS